MGGKQEIARRARKHSKAGGRPDGVADGVRQILRKGGTDESGRNLSPARFISTSFIRSWRISTLNSLPVKRTVSEHGAARRSLMSPNKT